MSQFLPETGAGAPQTDSVGSLLTPATLDISSGDIALMQKVLSAASRNPNLIPSDFMAYIVDYIQTSRLSIPIGQVFGFTQFTANIAASIATQDVTSSATYVDAAHAGPSLSGLPDGRYLLFYGAYMFQGYMSPSVNASTPVDADACISPSVRSSVMMMTAKDAKNSGSNTINMQYKEGAGQADFANRWLVALKYANL